MKKKIRVPFRLLQSGSSEIFRGNYLSQLRKSTEFESARTTFSEIHSKVESDAPLHTQQHCGVSLLYCKAVDSYKTRTKIWENTQDITSIAVSNYFNANNVFYPLMMPFVQGKSRKGDCLDGF